MAINAADIQGDELPPGTVLCGGQYSIEKYLNAGGFGVTYLARDSLGRRVVIKECFPSALCFRSQKTVRVRSQTSTVEFETILELFEKEARALASLQHPFIVGVHQYFRDNDTAYMAMDFVEGLTLLDIIEKDPARLTPEMVKAILIQLLQALSFIHRNDILHRDISPDNILIDDNDLPVLIDFGAAREDATRVSRALSKVLTVKDGYSPQEFYVPGSDQVYASDLYALAATFYHVVSGTAPKSSHSRMAAAARETSDPLKPLGRIDGYDKAFIGAINACLCLFPKDRLQTADAWQEAINSELRKKKLLKLAEQDAHLDQTVTQLVKDFFKDFHPVKPEPEKATVARPKPKETARARVVPATPGDVPKPNSDGEQAKATRSQDDGPVGPIRPARSACPQRQPTEAADPAPLPIERVRMKYAKPNIPEETVVEKTKGTILPNLFSRLRRASPMAAKSDDGPDSTEEMV